MQHRKSIDPSFSPPSPSRHGGYRKSLQLRNASEVTMGALGHGLAQLSPSHARGAQQPLWLQPDARSRPLNSLNSGLNGVGRHRHLLPAASSPAAATSPLRARRGREIAEGGGGAQA